MTENERAALQEFLARLKSARLPDKDPDVARLIDEAFHVQPDAPQLLVIKCLLQQRALDELRAQIETLQGQLAQAQAGSGEATSSQDRGWFARLTGAPLRPQPPPPAYPQQAAYPPPSGYAPQPPPPYAQPGYGPAYGGGGSSFLGSVARTAAGVAAGEFLFDGIEHLFHGGRSDYGYSSGGFFGGGPVMEQPIVENVTENVTVNDYGDRNESRGDYTDRGADAGNSDFIDDGTGFDDSSDDSFSI